MSLTSGSLETNTSGIDDAVISKVIEQLGADVQDIEDTLETCVKERADAVHSQKLAIAKYHAEIADINAEYYGVDELLEAAEGAVVDHNVMRHLKIDKSADDYKQIETYAPKQPHELTERMLKNIEELQYIGTAAESHPAPNEREKTDMREKMFGFLENSRVEEARLELELERAEQDEASRKERDEIAEALYLLQRLHNDKLSEMISDYRPSAFGKLWGSDPEYAEMVKDFEAIAEKEFAGDTAAGRNGRRTKKKKRANKSSAARKSEASDAAGDKLVALEAVEQQRQQKEEENSYADEKGYLSPVREGSAPADDTEYVPTDEPKATSDSKYSSEDNDAAATAAVADEGSSWDIAAAAADSKHTDYSIEEGGNAAKTSSLAASSAKDDNAPGRDESAAAKQDSNVDTTSTAAAAVAAANDDDGDGGAGDDEYEDDAEDYNEDFDDDDE